MAKGILLVSKAEPKFQFPQDGRDHGRSTDAARSLM
jgi:hypothetical protein